MTSNDATPVPAGTGAARAPITTLVGITPETARRSALVAALAAAPSAEDNAAAQQSALQDHFCRAIKAWARQTDLKDLQRDFKLRESLIDDACLDQWESDLQIAKYVVTRADGFFTISHSD